MKFTTSAQILLKRIRFLAAHSIRAALDRLQALGYAFAQAMRIIAVARSA